MPRSATQLNVEASSTCLAEQGTSHLIPLEDAAGSSLDAEIKVTDFGNESRKRRSAALQRLPIDDEASHYYPCPVKLCDIVASTRLERNHHLRTNHAGYVYKEGDGASKTKKVESRYNRKSIVELPPLVKPKLEPPDEIVHVPRELDDELVNKSRPTMIDLCAEDANLTEDMSSLTKLKNSMKESAREAKRKRGRPRNPPGSEPGPNSKVRVSDPDGIYRCYVPECNWRGGYRSIRADHMKWCHKDWTLPPRYILHRVSREGSYLDPTHFEPEYSCLVEGCSWKGNFRASRSTHMKVSHPEIQPMRKKAPVGGFMPDGKYVCHEPSCGWRGASRSTRAAHMKRQHPGYINPVYTQRNLPCCDCNVQCPSHKAFVDHMVCEHRIGGIVQREFTDVRDYEEWFDAVQESFSVEYVKRMGIKQTDLYQVLYLYCSRSGGYRPKRARSSVPYVSEYTKRRCFRTINKCGRNCAAFLRVVHWTDGRLTVVGCVEHTGHRMGTALLRLSPSEREVMDEYLYIQDDDTPLELMIDRLRDMEGYTADGFGVTPRSSEQLEQFVSNVDNEILSLYNLVTTSGSFAPESFFNVNLIDEKGNAWPDCFSIGIMTDDMKNLWNQFSHRAVCIEEVRLMISNWDVSLSFVLVFDQTDTPRCACVYISQHTDKTALLRQLASIRKGPIETFVTDCSPEWPVLIDQIFGETSYNTDVQIAEWHLLLDWANQVDQMVVNRVDKFSILCALRRWLRASDPTLFEAMIIDLFEAFREMELDELAQSIDLQLTDPEYSKRWTPLLRNPLTAHHNPILEIASRMFRERYLNCEICSRVDEYIALIFQRILEFNSVAMSDVYSTGAVEPMRVVPQLYEDVDPGNVLADGSLVGTCQAELDQNASLAAIKLEEFAEDREEIVEEVIIEEQIIEGPEAMQIVEESLSSLHYPSSSANVEDETECDRKIRINQMMQRLKEKMETLSDDGAMELMESSLSQVVNHLDRSIPLTSNDEKTAQFIFIQLLSLLYIVSYWCLGCDLVIRMSVDTIPRDLRGLRACLLCSLIKTIDQFEQDGCENCERALHLKGDSDKIYECTSSNFDGMIAAMQPEDSWVSKWQKINRKTRGMYAVSVSGSLPSALISDLKSMGIRYTPYMRETATK